MREVELKPLDKEHFWYGDVLIDIPQIRYEIYNSNWNTSKNHTVAGALGHLKYAAEALLGEIHERSGRTKTTSESVVRGALFALHQIGIKTGVTFK